MEAGDKIGEMEDHKTGKLRNAIKYITVKGMLSFILFFLRRLVEVGFKVFAYWKLEKGQKIKKITKK